MKFVNSSWVALVTAGLCVGVLGCGGGGGAVKGRLPVFPISGKVTYKGAPVGGADITFFNADKNKSAFGRTDDMGNFKLTTYAANDGAVEGKHVVVVVKVEATSPTAEAPTESQEYDPFAVASSAPPAKSKNQIPAKYSDKQTTDLIVMVNAEGGNPDVALELKD
jgi:hypothetical protein